MHYTGPSAPRPHELNIGLAAVEPLRARETLGITRSSLREVLRALVHIEKRNRPTSREALSRAAAPHA
jgi:hypothetical protein